MPADSANSQNDHGSRQWAVPVAAAVGLGAAVIAGALFLGDDEPPVGAPADVDVELGHVHGIGSDPDTGDLILGTHFGSWIAPVDGEPQLLSEVQDFMGFAQVDADRFVASGHPGPSQDAPGIAGLLTSDDGEQWATVSLTGEADFHSLDGAEDRLYGVDSANARLLRSDDRGSSWEEVIAAGVSGIVDVAVDPDDADVVLGTSIDGPLLSVDGGESFEPVAGAPLLLLVDWTDADTIVGLDQVGTVFVSTDGTETWDQRGSVGGPPEALHAESPDVIHAAIDGSVVESANGGDRFETRVTY